MIKDNGNISVQYFFLVQIFNFPLFKFISFTYLLLLLLLLLLSFLLFFKLEYKCLFTKTLHNVVPSFLIFLYQFSDIGMNNWQIYL